MAYDWYTLSPTAATTISAVPIQPLRCNTDNGIYRKTYSEVTLYGRYCFNYLKDALLGRMIAVLNITIKSKLTSEK